MSKPFLIEGPERERFELAADQVGFFLSHYKPRGFVIVDPAPTGYAVPEIPKAAKDEKPEGVIVNGVNLSAMKLTDLKSFAAEHGVPDAENYRAKDPLIEAISISVNAPAETD